MRVTAICRLTLASLLLVAPAFAAPKHKKKPPPSGDSGMTFEPETVERRDEPPPPPPSAKPSRPAPVRRVTAPPMKAGPASKTLERGLKFYEASDYPMASIELNKVIEGQSSDDDANRQRAEFYMG